MLAVFEDPQAGGDFVDEVVVVGDQQDGAFITLQRDVERVDGFEIEVVGRLVEDEDVGLGEDELAEDEARLFAAGEGLDGLFAFFAGEEHLAEDAANVFDVRGGIPAMQPLGDREVGFLAESMTVATSCGK